MPSLYYSWTKSSSKRVASLKRITDIASIRCTSFLPSLYFSLFLFFSLFSYDNWFFSFNFIQRLSLRMFVKIVSYLWPRYIGTAYLCNEIQRIMQITFIKRSKNHIITLILGLNRGFVMISCVQLNVYYWASISRINF